MLRVEAAAGDGAAAAAAPPVAAASPAAGSDATAAAVVAAACDLAKSLCVSGLRLRGRATLEVLATALLLLHRHLHRAPVGDDRDAALVLAAAAVHLAGKIRDTPRHLADTIAHYLAAARGVATPQPHTKEWVEAEEAVVRAERQLLHWSGYDVDVPSPWPLFDAAVARVDPPLTAAEADLARRALNELLTMPACVRWPVQALADAAVFLGAAKGGETRAQAVAAAALVTPPPHLAAIRQALLAHEHSRRRAPAAAPLASPAPAPAPAAAGAPPTAAAGEGGSDGDTAAR